MPWALAIYQNLTARSYDVFFDYESINSGDFEQIILGNIRARAHFLVVLTPSALERCENPTDWLRREIETAIGEKRNIVPLFLEGFNFGSPSIAKYLTGKLEVLKNYNGLNIPSDYFDEAMGRLCDRFLNISLDAVLHPISSTAQKIVKEQNIAAKHAKKVKQKELTAQKWFERGFAHAEAKETDDAIQCFTEAIRLQPRFALAYHNRGFERSIKGDLYGALADYDEAIRLKPDFVEAISNRGTARFTAIDIQGALADFNEAIRLKPDYAEAYYNRGLTRQQMGDLDGAIADYDEALRLKPDYYEAYHNRTIAVMLSGHERRAR